VKLIFSENAWEDHLYWQKTDTRILKRVNILIRDIQRVPYEGIGKPESLQHGLSGFWSHRSNSEHRLVYKADNDSIFIAQLRYHYSVQRFIVRVSILGRFHGNLQYQKNMGVFVIIAQKQHHSKRLTLGFCGAAFCDKSPIRPRVSKCNIPARKKILVMKSAYLMVLILGISACCEVCRHWEGKKHREKGGVGRALRKGIRSRAKAISCYRVAAPL
jgi:toxin YoeB